MATIGQRGKYAEGKVRAWMKSRSEYQASFDFYRFPDARAGSAQVVPADFEAFCNGANFLIEVKEVEHDFRLPAKNFSADKVARMAKRQLAGAECYILVYHRTTKLWRLVPLPIFMARAPSWDLSGFPEHAKVDTVMLAIFGER